MRVYRIQKAKYGQDISGYGSTLVSGRWHQAGKYPVLYTASNASLALLELLVHLPTVVKPPDLVMLTLELPDTTLEIVAENDLPASWGQKDYVEEVQVWGTQWLQRNSSLALRVPSVISADYNVLINPRHTAFSTVKLVECNPLTLDNRLI